MNPNDWLDTLPGDSWDGRISVENREDYPLQFMLSLECGEGEGDCCVDYCNLSHSSFTTSSGRSSGVVVSCAVPEDSFLGDSFSMNLITLGCKVNTTLCDNRTISVEYTVKKGYAGEFFKKSESLLEKLRENPLLLIPLGLIPIGFIGLIAVLSSGRSKTTHIIQLRGRG